EGQCAGIVDIAGDAAAGGATAHLQDTRADCSRAGVSIGSRVDQRAVALLRHAPGAGDRPRKSGAVRATEDERAVVDDVTCDTAARATTTDLQRAGRDRRSTRIAVIAGQGDLAGTPF